MFLTPNTEELYSILELFYNLSGIRIVIFDDNFREIISYPSEKCAFCREICSRGELADKCMVSDLNSFDTCHKTMEILIYKCHAGLVEATVPLCYGGRIIGYVMFGQITDIKDKNGLKEFVDGINEKYGTNCTTKGLKYKNKKQISAAARLLEICTEYIILKEMVIPKGNRTTVLAKEYINSHIDTDIKISDICGYAKVSRTRLYEDFAKDCGMGVAEYIRKKRLDYAKSLLKNTDISVSMASEKAGFSDYNYFSRVFKKKFGISPHKMKKM